MRGMRRALAALALGVAGALRAPDTTALGAEMLCKAAETCDLHRAFRILNSSLFSPEWLTQAGSSGEKPLRAALRQGCPQIVALILLHPDFDFSTIARFRQRRELILDIRRHAHAERRVLVEYGLDIMEAVRIGRVATEERQWSKAKSRNWTLPAPGEWFYPATIGDMGIELPVQPRLPAYVLQMAADGGMLETTNGMKVHAAVVAHLWYMVVAYLHAPEGSERREELRRHLRSKGWTYFFGSPSALSPYTHFIDLLARGLIGHRDMEEKHATLEITGGEGHTKLEDFEDMGLVLASLWNNTGDFVVVEI